MFEGLAGVPRPAHFFGLALQVVAGHIEPDGVSPDQVEGVGLGDVRAAAGKGGDQLNLVMDVVGYRWIREFPFAAGRQPDKIVRRFLENELWFPVRVVTHLAGVFGVIAPDAIDPAYRKLIVGAGNVGGGKGGWGMTKAKAGSPGRG